MVIKGQLRMQGKDYNFYCLTWIDFFSKIKEMVTEYKIKYPVGEDENIKTIERRTRDVQRL